MTAEQGGNDNFQSKGTACLVDDEKDILSVMKCLEQDRFIVHDFTDPRKALNHFLLNGKDCNVVISDIRMPGMNGFSFCRRVKE